jgi:hypothetical protein
MANVFNRNYLLRVQQTTPIQIPFVGSFVSVTLPFTVEFDIVRNKMSSANDANFRIYNLSANQRNSILKPQFTAATQIAFMAGYGTSTAQLPLAFSGLVTECVSFREGVDFISQITAKDDGNSYNSATVKLSFPAGTPYQLIVESLALAIVAGSVKSSANGLPVLSVGKIDVFPGVISRSMMFTGNPIERLKELVGVGQFYIDNGKINCTFAKDTFSLSDENIPIISSASGLLGTPILEQAILTVNILFNASISVGQQIFLKSSSGPLGYTGYYEVISVHHRGTISGSVCGDATTTLEVFAPKALSALLGVA